MSDSGPRPRSPELEAVQALLASMGISPTDLAGPAPGTPGLRNLHPRVAEAVSPVFNGAQDSVKLTAGLCRVSRDAEVLRFLEEGVAADRCNQSIAVVW